MKTRPLGGTRIEMEKHCRNENLKEDGQRMSPSASTRDGEKKGERGVGGKDNNKGGRKHSRFLLVSEKKELMKKNNKKKVAEITRIR